MDSVRRMSRRAVLLGAAVLITLAAVAVAATAEGAGQAYGLPSVLYVPVVLAALADGRRAAIVAAPTVTALYLGALWSHDRAPLELVTTGTVRLGVSVLIGVLIGSAVDHTRRDARAARQEARIDPLTGLGNRRALEDAWARRRREHPAGVVMLDMDGLKRLNDEQGHPAGDHALRALASAIELAIRPTDTATRVGGDEFVVLVDPARTTELRGVADRIAQGAHRAGVAASIGFAPIAGNDLDGLDAAIAAADTRMYELKAQRRAERGAVERRLRLAQRA